MTPLQRFLALFLTFLLLCSLFIAVNADEDEVEDQSPFNYDRKTVKGPWNWGNLNPKWKACAKGRTQSPIDLTNHTLKLLPKLKRLRRTYKPANAIIKNRGHDITVTWQQDAGSFFINGTEFKLQNCHWHTPSEHTVDGQRLKMEIHLVHKSAEGRIAVIGILYKLGRPDPFLAKFVDKIKGGIDHQGVSVGVVDPWEIKFGSRKYFRYTGSLTVPPCTEGVNWTILNKVRTVSREQIRALKDAVHDGFENNARPIQSSGKIDVFMYRPRSVGKY